MKAQWRIWLRAAVVRFYQEQALALLLFLGFAFGILTLTEHVILATFFCSHPGLLAIPTVLWGLYCGYVIRYLVRLVKLPEYEPLRRYLQMHAIRQQQKLRMRVALALLFPITVYGAFILLVSWREGVGEAYSWLLLPILLGWHAVLMAIWGYALRNPEGRRIQVRANSSAVRPRWQWPLWALRHQQPWLLIGTKAFTLLFLWVGGTYVQSDGLDVRAYGLILWVIGLAHLPIFTYWQELFRKQHAWEANLPDSWHRKAGQKIAALTVLLIPEFILWLRLTLRDAPPEILFTGIGFLWAALGALYFLSCFWPPVLSDRLGRVFMALVAGVLIIMYQIPLPVLIGFGTFAVFFLARRAYYRHLL